VLGAKTMGVVTTGLPARQRNSQDKQQRLLSAALELFAEQGLEGASTANIAKRAGVANGTLFHHFTSKQTLIAELYLRVKREVADTLAISTQDAISYQQLLFQQWLSFMRWSVQHPNQFRFIMQYAHSPQISRETRRQALFDIFGFVVACLHSGQKNGLVIEVDDNLLMDVVESLVLGTANHFLQHPQRLQQSDYQQQAFSMLWNALTADHYPRVADSDATQN